MKGKEGMRGCLEVLDELLLLLVDVLALLGDKGDGLRGRLRLDFLLLLHFLLHSFRAGCLLFRDQGLALRYYGNKTTWY